jgi:Tfp pilus assembly protein PilN
VTGISNNLKLADQVLSKEILFSKLLRQLATVTPSGALLTNISISQTTGGLEIQAITTDYTAATQLQVNLADPKNQIFSQADIESINCNGSTGNTSYPCSVNIRTLFASNNPFLFINSGKAGS